MLLLLVPLVASVRDFLQELPALVEEPPRIRRALLAGATPGAAENVQDGAEQVSVSIPDAISGLLGIAGSFFGVFLAAFTILFICLFLLSDIVNLKRALGSVLMPGEEERWLDVWERVTTSISRWAIGVVVIAAIAGTTQGTTAVAARVELRDRPRRHRRPTGHDPQHRGDHRGVHSRTGASGQRKAWEPR